MKYFITACFICCFMSIILGFILNVTYAQKLIGFGVVGLFFITFPLFIYHRWKNKDLKDYMLTKENIDKMKDSQHKNNY